ncbi:MAG: DNA-binding protein [Candidatus Omnitrophota bacterium]|nr:DNA-binding protein [Candidatus Omnitrophota bacterium]
MKINLKLNLIIIFFLALICARVSFAQELSSNELIRNAKQYDGKIITYCGEVIGDVMLRGNFAWVNINDGDNALGVWMSASLASQIKFTGNYKSRGDNLEIVGIFNRACLEHGGDLDIHAQGIRKIANGRMVSEEINLDKRNLALILLAALFLIWILTLFKKQ